jgi:hypothetical protein
MSVDMNNDLVFIFNLPVPIVKSWYSKTWGTIVYTPLHPDQRKEKHLISLKQKSDKYLKRFICHCALRKKLKKIQKIGQENMNVRQNAQKNSFGYGRKRNYSRKRLEKCTIPLWCASKHWSRTRMHTVLYI